MDNLEEILKSNKSFCLYPFVTLSTRNGYTMPCCHTDQSIGSVNEFQGIKKTKEYINIQQQMLAGLPVKQCSGCYDREKHLGTSQRIEDSLRMAKELELTDINSLDTFNKPKFYQIRANNLCNLMCRTCVPENSNLIQEEYIRLKLHDENIQYKDSGFELLDLTDINELYVAGGEPLVQKEFKEFLKKCIEEDTTDFKLIVNTNAVSFQPEMYELLGYFSNLHLQFSLDGYGKVNDYIRWPSKWDKVIQNIIKLEDIAYSTSIHTVLSIYNVNTIYELFSFLETQPIDQHKLNFSLGLVISQDDILSADLYPDYPAALASLQKCKSLAQYSKNNEFKSIIDKLCLTFADTQEIVDTERLRKFFTFNDLLDSSRQVSLKDYIPDLDNYRKYVV